jgi:IS30 family transposase
MVWKKDKWMMTAVDTHSKFLFAVPLKSKKEKEVNRAFKALLAQIKKQTKMTPKNVLTDNGTEFIKAVYASKDINHLLTKPGERPRTPST